jgi:hypothetical protein
MICYFVLELLLVQTGVDAKNLHLQRLQQIFYI